MSRSFNRIYLDKQDKLFEKYLNNLPLNEIPLIFIFIFKYLGVDMKKLNKLFHKVLLKIKD